MKWKPLDGRVAHIKTTGATPLDFMEDGSDDYHEDRRIMLLLFRALNSELLCVQKTTQETCYMLKIIEIGVECVREVVAQTRRTKFENLTFMNGERWSRSTFNN